MAAPIPVEVPVTRTYPRSPSSPRILSLRAPADASVSPDLSSFAEALSIWAVDDRIAFASAPATASAWACS